MATIADLEPSALSGFDHDIMDQSKANAFVKGFATLQALWFCMQCVTRLSQSLALSLLELNTFAHCISTLCVYMLWWHKPYDVSTHQEIKKTAMKYDLLLRKLRMYNKICFADLARIEQPNTENNDCTTNGYIRYGQLRKNFPGYLLALSIPGTPFRIVLVSSPETDSPASPTPIRYWLQPTTPDLGLFRKLWEGNRINISAARFLPEPLTRGRAHHSRKAIAV